MACVRKHNLVLRGKLFGLPESEDDPNSYLLFGKKHTHPPGSPYKISLESLRKADRISGKFNNVWNLVKSPRSKLKTAAVIDAAAWRHAAGTQAKQYFNQLVLILKWWMYCRCDIEFDRKLVAVHCGSWCSRQDSDDDGTMQQGTCFIVIHLIFVCKLKNAIKTFFFFIRRFSHFSHTHCITQRLELRSALIKNFKIWRSTILHWHRNTALWNNIAW